MNVPTPPADDPLNAPPDPDAPPEAAHATLDPFDALSTKDDRLLDDVDEVSMRRRPPPPPPGSSVDVQRELEPELQPDVPPPPNSNLAWGLHDPVARWKRIGLIVGSASVGAAVISGLISNRIAQRSSDEWNQRMFDLPLDETAGLNCYGRGATRSDGGRVDPQMDRACTRGQAANRVLLGSMVVGTLGLASTVTFGVLHFVRRTDVPMTQARVRPTRDGLAVRF